MSEITFACVYLGEGGEVFVSGITFVCVYLGEGGEVFVGVRSHHGGGYENHEEECDERHRLPDEFDTRTPQEFSNLDKQEKGLS